MKAKTDARKAGLGSRVTDRIVPVRAEPTRTESSERPSGGPPRLALAGNKPTWREREEARNKAEATGGVSSATPPTDNASEEVQLPKKTSGYVPPGRRGGDVAPRGRSDNAPAAALRDESSSAEPTARWRPGAPRGELGRDGSPADRPTPKYPRAPQAGRASSPAEGARPISSSGTARTDSPASEVTKPAPGKYVPVHLRNK